MIAIGRRAGAGHAPPGHLLESTWSKGEWTDDLLYAVLRREWPAVR
jgi:RimJ/RimL family protein N-acetyltransferase